MYRILLIEDDVAARRSTAAALVAAGHEVVAVDPGAALDLLDERFDVAIAAVDPSHAPRAEVAVPRPPHVLVSWPRPYNPAGVCALVDGLRARARASSRGAAATLTAAARPAPGEIVGDSPAMRRVLAQLDAIRGLDAPVLITGETGTGKELFATALHRGGPRPDGPFVAVNCAAIPDTLVEAELFGHDRGAFTGAVQRRPGRFVAAHGGTLLLDEVDALSPEAQAKLLRVLQDGTFFPLGATSAVRSDARVVCTSNRDLAALVADRRFREDLYYRIAVIELVVPPLRGRRGDLPRLVHHFLARWSPVGQPPPTIAPRAWAALSQHPFPGNVRELEHAIRRGVAMSRGREIDLEHLPPALCFQGAAAASDAAESTCRPLAEAVAIFELEYVTRALEQTGGHKGRAAQLLGISRKRLWLLLNRLGAAQVDRLERDRARSD